MTFAEKVGQHFKKRSVVFHFVAGDQVIGEVSDYGENWVQVTGEEGKDIFVNPGTVMCVEPGEE